MSFEIDPNYVDVAERISTFREKHPEGSLQQVTVEFREFAGLFWIVFTAAAYRTPDDIRPGQGTAWEQVPGKTPYTKGSELQNAETAAWGRAIVAALAADTKRGIASQEEVRNRIADRQADAERPEVPPLAAAKARAWNAAKALWTADTDDERKASTEAALAGMGSSIADADTDTWNTLADIWIAALERATKGAQA
jgi:hypothetical protein